MLAPRLLLRLLFAVSDRAIDVLPAADADMIRRKDEENLRLATAQERVLYSFNVADFHEIDTGWMATGRAHRGIILAQQKGYTVGEQIRRRVRLIGSLTDEAMRNREEFLSQW